MMSLPLRGAWIEIWLRVWVLALVTSLPLRGAWIEIRMNSIDGGNCDVAPLAGGVD